MSRARNIKPGFFKNEHLAECSAFARLCFAGLWTLADRDGRLEDRPRRIKGELFAFDSVDVDPLLSELEAHNFLVRYRNEDGKFIQILKFHDHQSPHYSEKPSVIKPINFRESRVDDDNNTPSTHPEHSEKTTVIKRGSQPPDSLIPDSLIPDCGVSVQPAASPLSGPATQKRVAKPAAKGAETWAAYADAYEARYGAPPVRNGTVNSLLGQVVERLGAADAPAVAAFYVRQQNGLYVSAMHPVNLLLRDAEKIRTEWFTGRSVTRTQGQQADRTQTNANAFAPLIAAALAEETERKKNGQY